MKDPLVPGALLLAAPSMVDPNFEGTVVLLCIQETEGSIGLVLNRPLAVRAADVLPAAGLAAAADSAVRWGGPVAPTQVFLLHEAPVSSEEGRKVTGDLHFGGGLDAAQRIAASGGRLRFFTGYAGWSEGQLQEERRAGGWLVLPPDPGEAWAQDSQWQWERLVARAAPELDWMRRTDQPERN